MGCAFVSNKQPLWFSGCHLHEEEHCLAAQAGGSGVHGHAEATSALHAASWPWGYPWLCVAQADARFEHVLSLIRSDTFGWADFFEPLVNSISSGGDFYLLANDFVSYLEAQARARATVPGLASKRVAPCVSWPTA